MVSEILTLQELSIKVVIDEFSWYTAAHKSTNSEWFKKNLLFLQRVYSYSIFQELDRNGKLKDEHLDFLLNAYLRKLDVGSLLSLTSKENVVQKVIPIAHSLTELSCYKEYNVPDCLYTLREVLPHAVGVTKVCIPTICNNDLLKLIASTCSQLTYLDIFEASISPEGLRSLYRDGDGETRPKCPLKHINLIDTALGDEDVAGLLRNVPSLEEVLFPRLPNVLQSIHRKEDTDNNIIAEEAKKYNLTSLDFSLYDDTSLPSDLLRMCSQICPKVRKLALPISKDEELELCCLFSNLEDISILNDTVPTINLNHFLEAIGKQLKCLTVSSFGLSVSTLIDNCANLETLALKSVQYQERDPKTTNTLTHLHTVQLDSITFVDHYSTDSVIALLNSSPNLEKLSLLYCDFSESDMVEKLSAYSNNCKLKHLGFDYSDVEVDLLHHFVSNCTSLESLSLENCENLSVDDIAMLNHNIEASNRKIEIQFLEDEDFISSYSDYEVNHDVDFDDEYGDYYDGYYDYEDYDDDDDDDDYRFGHDD